MQRWEYHIVLLVPDKSFSGQVKSWKINIINEEKVPNWYSADGYSSLRVFCNQMGQEGWELVSAGLSPSQ